MWCSVSTPVLQHCQHLPAAHLNHLCACTDATHYYILHQRQPATSQVPTLTVAQIFDGLPTTDNSDKHCHAKQHRSCRCCCWAHADCHCCAAWACKAWQAIFRLNKFHRGMQCPKGSRHRLTDHHCVYRILHTKPVALDAQRNTC